MGKFCKMIILILGACAVVCLEPQRVAGDATNIVCVIENRNSNVLYYKQYKFHVVKSLVEFLAHLDWMLTYI